MIKNYTSNSKQTFDKIQKILSSHKANQILFEYDDNGKLKSLSFSLKIADKTIGFKLPARVESVEAIFYQNKKPRYSWREAEPLDDKEKDQAYRTAWANIRDWLDAQMALIDTGQVKIEEVFLPYAVNHEGKTYFEVVSRQGYQLPSGKNEGTV